MFSKTADPTSAPAAPTRAPGGNARSSILAQDLKITGEIHSSGTVEILGEVDGNVTARGLVIGNEGRVTGTVQAETVEVKGKLDGAIASQAFTLRAAAQVKADVAYSVLVIESGAQIEGRFTRGKGA